jgi:hypothetical protein
LNTIVISNVLKVLAIFFGVALLALVGFIIYTAYIFRGFDSTPPRTKEHLGRWYTKFDQLYPDSTIVRIAADLEYMNDVFRRVPDHYDIMLTHAGYGHSGDRLYYTNCMSGSRDLPATSCNIDCVFEGDERSVFLQKVKFLKEHHIPGYSGADLVFTGHFPLDMADYQNRSDLRFLALEVGTDTAFLRRTEWVILDNRCGLLLIGSKDSWD